MMQIDEIYLSHPNKKYIYHCENIKNSFEDKEHKICALYHDLAKIYEIFQKYICLKEENFNSYEDFKKAKNKLKTTHAFESAYIYFFTQTDKNFNFLANFFTILKHHSHLPNIKEHISNHLVVVDNQINKAKNDKINSVIKKANLNITHNVDEMIDFFYDLEKDFANICKLENFFILKKRFSRLILADKFEAIFSKSYENVDFLKKDKICNFLENLENEISQKNQNLYRQNAREIIFSNFAKNKDKNKFLIKAPTGIGKTYIALELALKIAKEKNKRRIITAMPFTSIIEQTFTEYEKIIGKNNILKYYHLSKILDDSNDETEQFMQKIFLADIWHEHFIITTFNQLLNTFFSNLNKDNLRLETLKQSVIILDEIQNIPRVLLKSMSFTLNEFAKKYEIDFILMSATMPKIEEELENFTIISDKSFYENKNNRYILKFDNKIKNFDNLEQKIKEQQGNTICIVNTIEKAKMLYKRFKNNKNSYLLTTHHTPKHRKKIIEKIKKELQNKNKKVILISTQLIEAGVDLDFDIGFREFAPFAAIIQTAGRVNREGYAKTPSDVFIFDFLQTKNNLNKTLPYHITDLQIENIKIMLQNNIEEKEIFEKLEEYFSLIKSQTTHVKLENFMKNLDFQTLFTEFNKNFMPKQPWKVSLFIEQKDNHFDKFIKKREEILANTKDKFEALAKIKQEEKKLSKYTISISEILIKKLKEKENINELFGRYILKFNSPHYNKKEGFTDDISIFEETFS